MSVNRQQDLPACVRHPDRPTGLRCVRCDRPACPDCLREASVGYQCVDCVAEGSKTIRPARTVGGARAGVKQLVVVPVLIGINVLVFAVMALQAQSVVDNQQSSVYLYGTLIPAAVAEGDYWRLLTSGFLHFGNYGGFGPVHLIFNMFALWVLGRDLEVALGRVRFLAVYLISLLGGSAAVMLFSGVEDSTVGASGAIYGLFGGIAVVVFRSRMNPTPVLTLLGVNIFLSVALPGISLAGHLGGLVAGALATAALVYAPKTSKLTQFQVWSCVALVVVLVALVALRVSVMDTHCVVTTTVGYCYPV